MSDMLGLSPDSMNQLISAFNQQKETLNNVITQIEGQVNAVSWQGQDATKFKSSDWPDSKTKLTAVIQSFEGVVQALNKQLTEQQQASGN
jgi:uncharacterized protein YukE